MTKGILDHAFEEGQVSISVVGRVIVVAGLILGSLHFGVERGLSVLELPELWQRQLNLGFFLFLIWLAVNGGIRAVNKLLPGIAVGWLFITGIGTGAWGQAIFSLAQWAFFRYNGEETFPFLFYLLPGLLPSLAVSLLVAVLTAITLRVENSLMAFLLRLLIFGVLTLLIYLWI